MSEKKYQAQTITKENFKEFGDLITTEGIEPLNINNGFAKRFDDIAQLNTKSEGGETTISIFSALKRNFPMQIDMMEKHPLGSQAFIPMKETNFLCFVAPAADKPDLSKAKAFFIPKGLGINFKPGTWHFPLISTENMNFLVVDRKGQGENLVIKDLKSENIYINY
jgi:ureidoglycolate lyase